MVVITKEVSIGLQFKNQTRVKLFFSTIILVFSHLLLRNGLLKFRKS
jgi:hypothetical protein